MSDLQFYVIGLLVVFGMAACLFISTFTPRTDWLQIVIFVGTAIFWTTLGFKCGWEHARQTVRQGGFK